MLNIDELFEEKRTSVPSLVKGKWYRVQWTPDLSAGERLNLGVAFVPVDGKPYVQTIEEFGRLRCLFDESAEFHARLACRVAELMVESEPNPEMWNNPQLRIVEGGFAQGESTTEIVDRLMSDVVPLGVPQRSRAEQHKPINQKRAYKQVNDALSFRLGNKYREHVPENPKVSTEIGINLFLPFRRSQGSEAATLVSADFTKPEKIKGELYIGQRDITMATRQNEFKRGAMFILRPGGYMKREVMQAAEEEVREFSRYLQSLGIPYYLGKDTEELTDIIKDWCVSEAA